MFKKILVPVDGSEGSWRALDTAVELGKKFGGELHVINVIQPYNNAALLAVPLDHATAVGDGAGITRGLSQASASGVWAARVIGARACGQKN